MLSIFGCLQAMALMADAQEAAETHLNAESPLGVWTAELTELLRSECGIVTVASVPSDWTAANVGRGPVAFAPARSIARRCILTLLKHVSYN